VNAASPGRRSNGLASADWGALVDLDPRLSEALLDRLASAGVAAYVEPAGGTSDALSRATPMPGRPLDRLWVDPGRADAARAVVGAEVADLSALLGEQEPGATAHGLVQPVPRTAARRVLPPPPLPDPPPRAATPPPAADVQPVPTAAQDDGEPAPAPTPEPPLDPEEQWRRIVESYDASPDLAVPPWPVEEDVDPSPGRPRRPRTDPAPTEDERPRRPLRRRTDRPEPADALPGWVEPAPIEDDGGYVPPPPPPVPRVHPRKLLAAAAVVLGILMMFAPRLLGQGETVGTGLVGLMLTAGGAAALVWWMRDAPPTDSGPDDGAIV
jgi:hypothetical protein